MDTNFSLSLELIYLMNWLLKNEKEKLKILINQSIKNGLSYEMEQLDKITDNQIDPNDNMQLHNTILDFLIFLEDTLVECLEDQELDTKSKERLNLSIQKILPQQVDIKTMWLSVQQTKEEISKIKKVANKSLGEEELRNTLLTQLIKNWNPKNNETIN
ncbi:hypothetical protein K9M16_03170 [Candidatus Babeliales bacterium]|nr:hypothetical protein [Candidatus Babeliales bacterium]